MDTSKPSHVRQLFPVDLPLSPSPSPPPRRRKIAVALRRRYSRDPATIDQLMSEMSLVGGGSPPPQPSERKRKQTSPRKFTVGSKRKAPSSGVERTPPPPLSDPTAARSQKSKKKSQRPDLVHPHPKTKLLVPFVVKVGDQLIKNLFPSPTIVMQKNEYGLYVYEGFVLNKKSVCGKYLGDGQVGPLTDEDFEKAKELKIII